MHITTLYRSITTLSMPVISCLLRHPKRLSLSLKLRTSAFNRMLAKVAHAALLPAKGASTKGKCG